MRSTPPIRARQAFTLVEMIIAMAIAAMVLMAVASLIGLSTKAVPADDSVQVTAIEGGEFLSKFAADAAIALDVTESAAEAVTFVIPDQTGDAAADTVRYVWSGVSGEPLARILNGSDRLDVLGDVRAFAIDYAFDDVPAYSTLGKTTSANVQFQSSLASVATSQTVGATTVGQVFAPVLPSRAIAWTLDELRLSLGTSGLFATSTLKIEIRGCDAVGNPTDAVYATQSVSESSFGLLGLLPSSRTFSFSNIIVPASERLCVVVRCSGGDGSAAVGTAVAFGWPSEAPALTSTDGGTTWSRSTTVVLGHSVRGRVIRLQGGAATRHVVSRFGVSGQAGPRAWAFESGVTGRNPGEAGP